MGLTRTRFSQANTVVAKIQDPITVLNSSSTLANVDVGFLINRDHGSSSNVALFWQESSNEFITALTANAGVSDSNITVTSYANLRSGSIFANIGGGNDQANVYITGSLIPSSNVAYDLGTNGRRFRDLWLSGTTLHMGDQRLTVTNSEWRFTTPTTTVVLGTESTVGNLTVTGNLNLQGSSSTFDSNNLSVQDSIIELHTLANLAPLTGDDGRDIGLKFHYYKTQDEHAFLGWSNDSGYLEWYDSGREGVGNVFTGNTYGGIKSGTAWLVNTTPSTSTTTGVLRVSGGVGIAGNLYIAGAGDVSANIGTIKTNLDQLDANVSAYQTYANANAASQAGSISSLTSNAATQHTAIASLDANVGTITTEISSIVSGANANTAAYLLTATGNIAAGNMNVTGNVYGGIVPTAIFKDVYIGSTAVSLARGTGALTVDDFNTTGYAAQANLATLATNATKTTVTSNISSGTAYVTFVNATAGNVDQNINTALTYNPQTGNLRAYTAFVDTDLVVGGNLTVQNISYTNQEIITTTEIAQGNLVANSGVESTSNVTGAVVVRGGIGATGNVYTKTLYTLDGIRWAGNGNVFASGGGGGGALTSSNTAPASPSVGDFWYKISVDTLYQYINDGTTSYWIDTQSPILFANTSTTLTALGETTITGNLVPSANITYSLGTSTNRFKDLFLSGTTIDLGGATIKTDASSGAIALIPQPTVANPNPTGIVVSPSGTVSTVSTTGGELAANAIGNSSNSAVASATTTFGNIDATGNITTANLIANSNVVANKITTTTGFFWSNGTAFASSTYGNTEVAAYLVANPQGSTYSNANVASYLTSNVSGITSTTGALNVPIGTTEERPASAQLGSLRYNTTLGVAEVYTLSGWTTITGAVPTITNVTPSSYGGEVGAVFTIFGTGFQPDALVRFVTANASEYISNTVSYGNTTTLQATTPRAFSVAEGPLDVRVIQANGSASVTRFDAIQTGTSPTWTTASGTIATIYDNATGTHATIEASDSESSITYSIASGSLPPGTTLNASTGAITGDPTDVASQTTSTFTAAATDGAGNQTTRSFSIVVRPYLDGSTSAKAAGSPAQIATVLGTTPSNGVYWYKNSGYNSGNAFQAYTDWSVNSNTGYMILTQSQVSGAAITNFTDLGTLSTSVSGTRGHGNTFREPTATILSNWSGDTANRCIVGQYRTSTGTTLATGTNIQWIQIAVTPAVFKTMFDDVPGGGEFTGSISARSAGGTGSFYWSKTNSEYPNHLQMGNASSDNGWNGNNYIEIRQAGGDTNHSFFVAGDGGGSYWAASLAYNGGSGDRVGFFGFAPNNSI